MKKKLSVRKDTRRRRVTWVIIQGVLIYIMCYFPAARWSQPVIPIFMAAVFTILATAKSKTVRAGFWRGIIFGVLAGIATWGGLDYTADKECRDCETVINFDYDIYLQKVEQAKVDARAAAERGDIDAEKLATIESFVPPEPPTEEDVANAQARLEELTIWRKSVPFYAIPPTIVVCSTIGLYFGARSQQRRRKTESEWHTI